MFTNQGIFNSHIKNLIKQGKNSNVKSCIKGLTPTDLIDSSQTSLLHLSAKYNNHDLTKHLIKIKCNVNAKNDSKTTPLMVAAISNSFKTAQILIQANADIYAKNSSKQTALQLLLNNKKIPQYLYKYCLEKIKNDSSSDKVIAKRLFPVKSPLNFVISLEKPNVTRMIINHHGHFDPQQSCAAMDLALKLGNKENVSLLLQAGVTVDISKCDAVMFLKDICVMKNESQPCLLLISAFLDKVRDWDSLTITTLWWLGYIFQYSTKEVLNLFLQYDINDYVKKLFPGQDLYVNLYRNNQPDVKEMLKQLNTDVNSHGQDDCTALHFAVDRDDLTQVQALLHAGADPNKENRRGQVPLDFVKIDHSLHHNSPIQEQLDSGERKMIELLLDYGADPQLKRRTTHGLYCMSEIKLQLLLSHLAILESQGVEILESVREAINGSSDFINLYNTCCRQLEELKAIKVYGSVTLYTILVANPEEVFDSLRYMESLKTIIGSYCPEKLHFYYASKLQNAVDKISHIMDLRAKASTFICESTGLLSSQYIILEKIISFLSYKDLLVFE